MARLSHDPEFEDVLLSAARLQELVPDAVLVGGSAAALHVHHRVSFDHDHVISDLRSRFDVLLDALEREGNWVTNRVSPGKIILGELGGIEAGVRQMIRARPLETEQHILPDGSQIVIPTAAEALRIKAFLAVRRNQVRDYLDIAALADRMGTRVAADVLAEIDQFYADQQNEGATVASQVAVQLANPKPRDLSSVRLKEYKGLIRKWQNWEAVTEVCRELAELMVAK